MPDEPVVMHHADSDAVVQLLQACQLSWIGHLDTERTLNPLLWHAENRHRLEAAATQYGALHIPRGCLGAHA